MVQRQENEETPRRRAEATDADPTTGTDLDQIVERLGWTPKQRLVYLVDMLAFEERARGARRVA